MSCVSVLLCTISQNLMSPVYGGLGGGGEVGSIAHPPLPHAHLPPPTIGPILCPQV